MEAYFINAVILKPLKSVEETWNQAHYLELVLIKKKYLWMLS